MHYSRLLRHGDPGIADPTRRSSPAERSTRTRVALLARSRAPDDPELIEARRELAEATRDSLAARLAEHIQKAMTKAPPLTHEQIGRIVATLTNAPRADAT
jgi:hypothetical protein